MGGEARRELLGQEACPPGYLGQEQLELRERREQRAGARGRGEAERERERGEREEAGGEGTCRAGKGPEPIGELMQIQNESGRRARGGQAGVKTGAYASAVADAKRIATASGTLPGSAGEWTPRGQGPADRRRQALRRGQRAGPGRPERPAVGLRVRPKGRRLYAAVGEGGVWVADEKAGFNDWRSIGDTLPTQAVGGIDFSPADGGTVIVSTGDNVFGGGGTFSGLGVFRTTDGGRSWQRASGVPDGIIAFKVAVDPTNPRVVYAAHRRGPVPLDRRRRLVRQRQPADGPGRRPGSAQLHRRRPRQGGLRAREHGHGRRRPGPAQRQDRRRGAGLGRRRRRLARRQQAEPAVQGLPGRLRRVAEQRHLPLRHRRARLVLEGRHLRPGPARARGERLRRAEAHRPRRARRGRPAPDQDHNYLYAIVEDAERFRGGIGAIDVPEEETGPVPGNTVLNGIYVSPDFGKTWTRMADAEQLKDPTSGSALTGTACATLYCPGVQAWYNLQIAPDPTRQNAAGVPTRMVFGLEEVWKNKVDGPLERADAVRRRRPLLRRRHLPVPQHRAAGLPDHGRLRRHHHAPGPARVDLDPAGRRRRSRSRSATTAASTPRRPRAARRCRPTTGAAAPTAASTRCCPTTPRSRRTARSTRACRTTAS